MLRCCHIITPSEIDLRKNLASSLSLLTSERHHQQKQKKKEDKKKNTLERQCSITTEEKYNINNKSDKKNSYRWTEQWHRHIEFECLWLCVWYENNTKSIMNRWKTETMWCFAPPSNGKSWLKWKVNWKKKYGWRSIDALKASDAKIDIYMNIYKGTMGAVVF